MKRRYRLYVDTSVWNRLGDRAAWLMRRESYRFLNRGCSGHDILVSPLVLEEIHDTPELAEKRTIERFLLRHRPDVISGQDWAESLANSLAEAGKFGPRMLVDLTHVGYAVRGAADAIVTWDRRTLARDKVRRAVQIVCRRQGLTAPLLGTPEEMTQWLRLKT